jgi:hypothetical protein
MLVNHPHMPPMLHLSLIQGQAMSHLNFTLSLTMALPQCRIFALTLSPPLWRILSFNLPQFKCILKSKWEPGNQSLTWKSRQETSLANIELYPLLIKIVRGWKAELCSLVTVNNNLGYLLRISLGLKMRSIPLLLCLTVPKIYGKCQHQLILIPVDYVAHPGLQF